MHSLHPRSCYAIGRTKERHRRQRMMLQRKGMHWAFYLPPWIGSLYSGMSPPERNGRLTRNWVNSSLWVKPSWGTAVEAATEWAKWSLGWEGYLPSIPRGFAPDHTPCLYTPGVARGLTGLRVWGQPDKLTARRALWLLDHWAWQQTCICDPGIHLLWVNYFFSLRLSFTIFKMELRVIVVQRKWIWLVTMGLWVRYLA